MDFADPTLVYLAKRESLSTIHTVVMADFTLYRIEGKRKFRLLPGVRWALLKREASNFFEISTNAGPESGASLCFSRSKFRGSSKANPKQCRLIGFSMG